MLFYIGKAIIANSNKISDKRFEFLNNFDPEILVSLTPKPCAVTSQLDQQISIGFSIEIVNCPLLRINSQVRIPSQIFSNQNC